MITLMVNRYAEPSLAAIASARVWIPAIDVVVDLDGRYEGFPQIAGHEDSPVFDSEHAKRNRMLELAGPADPDRWLLWLDCDERVTRASPQLPLQLSRFMGDVAGIRFVEPLPPPDHSYMVAALGHAGRTVRDTITPMFGGRLIRHLPGLEYVGRHDRLIDQATGRQLMGWPTEPVVPPLGGEVDLEVAHLWWEQPAARRAAKEAYYLGPFRQSEIQTSSA